MSVLVRSYNVKMHIQFVGNALTDAINCVLTRGNRYTRHTLFNVISWGRSITVIMLNVTRARCLTCDDGHVPEGCHPTDGVEGRGAAGADESHHAHVVVQVRGDSCNDVREIERE